MSAYKEWAKRNGPTQTPAANDPDRFFEFSQADLDAYAAKAFLAGSRSNFNHAVACSRKMTRWADRAEKFRKACDVLSFKLAAYQGVAVLGWACAIAAAWYWG